jgi:hypothetical protein
MPNVKFYKVQGSTDPFVRISTESVKPMTLLNPTMSNGSSDLTGRQQRGRQLVKQRSKPTVVYPDRSE